MITYWIRVNCQWLKVTTTEAVWRATPHVAGGGCKVAAAGLVALLAGPSAAVVAGTTTATSAPTQGTTAPSVTGNAYSSVQTGVFGYPGQFGAPSAALWTLASSVQSVPIFTTLGMRTDYGSPSGSPPCVVSEPTTALLMIAGITALLCARYLRAQCWNVRQSD